MHELAPGSIEYHRATTMHKCGVALAVHVAAGGICMIMIAVDRATAGPGSRRATGPGLRMHARAGAFFWGGGGDPRILGSSKIRTDPRRIRIDPGFGGFVLPLV